MKSTISKNKTKNPHHTIFFTEYQRTVPYRVEIGITAPSFKKEKLLLLDQHTSHKALAGNWSGLQSKASMLSLQEDTCVPFQHKHPLMFLNCSLRNSFQLVLWPQGTRSTFSNQICQCDSLFSRKPVKTHMCTYTANLKLSYCPFWENRLGQHLDY